MLSRFQGRRLLILSAAASLFVCLLWGLAPASPSPQGIGRPLPAGRALLPGRYAAVVGHVVDGDTVEARIAVWLGQEIVARVRLRGIDAPEIRGACGAERDLALAARERLRALAEGRDAVLTEVGGDKYFGRVVAALSVDGVDAGGRLLAEGFARPYAGGRRTGWCALTRPPRLPNGQE